MLIYDRVDERRKHIKAACILLTVVILIAAAIGVGYLTYSHHAGPVLGQRTEICYYSHKKLALSPTAGMSENKQPNLEKEYDNYFKLHRQQALKYTHVPKDKV